VDAFGRPLAKQLSTQLNDSIVVDNRGGAGGTVGAAAAAKMTADGYTWLLGAVHHSIAPSMYVNLPYDITKDFEPIALIASVPHVIVVNPTKFPKNDLKSIMEEIRKNPGKYNYASTGNGTSQHLAGELFKMQNKLFITHIPYRGTGPALQDLVAGQVDMMFDAVTTMNEFVKENKVIALATTGKTRSAITPNIPTVNDAGVPRYEATIWVGFMAPKGTPTEVVTTLNNAIRKIISQQDVKETWAKQGALPLVMTPTEFTKYLDADIAKWSAIVKSAGIKPD
jgi:tripartite-type tricarboxylate transporter receptor subunit TctC